MKQYLLSVIQPDGPAPPAEVLERIDRDLDALNEEMRAAGAWVFAGGCTRRARPRWCGSPDGETLVTDGPFAEGKEHVGGFTIVKAPDLDAALAMGRQAGPGHHPAGRGAAVPGRRPGTEPGVPAHPRLGDRGCLPRAVRPRGRRPGRRLRRHRPRRGGGPGGVRRGRRPAGRPPGRPRARPAGSSPPPATRPSTGSAARPPATTATPRRPCCTPRTNRPRRAPCATTGCG